MKRLLILFFCFCCLFFTATAQVSFEFTCQNKQPETEADFKSWIKKEVFWITTDKEKEEFSKLKSNKEKNEFINNFWLRRDPDPDTSENEFKTEYCQRISFTDNFDTGIPGWRTDRGMIYIFYGKTDKIEKGRTNFEGLENILFEKWLYEYLPGEKPNTEFTFFDPTESNEFRLEKTTREELIKNLGTGLRICFNCPSL